ncbi:MAG: hypothetical protein OHK0056_26570 [Bacteriovoracaceae bacterium]
MKYLLLALLLVLNIFAEDDCINCSGEKLPEINPQIGDLAKVANQNTCKEDFYLDDATKEYQNALRSEFRTVTKSFDGTRIVGRSDEMDLLSKALGEKSPSWFKKKSANCKDPHCMLTALYNSKEVAMRSFAMFKNSGFVLSADQPVKEAEYTWSPQETRMLHETMRYLPSQFQKLNHLDELSIIPKGYSLKGEADTLAWAVPRLEFSGLNYTRKGSITFTYDSLKSRTPHDALHTIIHEFAHHLDYTTTDKMADGDWLATATGYRELNGWRKDVEKVDKEGKKYKDWRATAPKTCFVSAYAATLPTEDFAEAIAEYFLNPTSFKKKCPKHYNLLKDKIFKGREFSPPWPTTPTDRIAKECLKTDSYSIVWNNNKLLSSRDYQFEHFKIESFPRIEIDQSCFEVKMNSALDQLNTVDQRRLCMFQGRDALVQSMKIESNRALEKINQGIYRSIENFDWKSASSKCELPIKYNSTCIKDQVINSVLEQNDLDKNLIASGLKITNNLNPQIIDQYFGGELLIDCLKKLNEFQMIGRFNSATELIKERGSVYCGTVLSQTLQKNKIWPEKLTNSNQFMQYEYFKNGDVLKRADLMQSEFSVARASIECGYFGKRKCLRDKMYKKFKSNPDDFKSLPKDISESDFHFLVNVFEEEK